MSQHRESGEGKTKAQYRRRSDASSGGSGHRSTGYMLLAGKLLQTLLESAKQPSRPGETWVGADPADAVYCSLRLLTFRVRSTHKQCR